MDTLRQRLLLLEAKRLKYLQGVQDILHNENKSMALLAKTAGHLVHIATVHRAGAANIQPLWDVIYMEKKQWTRSLLENEPLTVDDDLKDCLQWWEKALSIQNIERKFWKTFGGQFFIWSNKSAERFAHRAITVCTDASDSGWGASTNVLMIAGKWSDRQKETSINWRELKTTLIALSTWNFIHDSPVLILSDSTTVVAAIRKRASKAEALQCLVKELMKIEKRRKIEVVAAHLPGTLNDLPDRLSRELPTDVASLLSFDWQSLPDSIRNITQVHGITCEGNQGVACPFKRRQQLNVDTRPLLIALSTPDIPFLKIHLTKLAKHPERVFILLPKVPTSELPLSLTEELKIVDSPICLQSEKTKWIILEVVRRGGITAKNVM